MGFSHHLNILLLYVFKSETDSFHLKVWAVKHRNQERKKRHVRKTSVSSQTHMRRAMWHCDTSDAKYHCRKLLGLLPPPPNQRQPAKWKKAQRQLSELCHRLSQVTARAVLAQGRGRWPCQENHMCSPLSLVPTRDGCNATCILRAAGWCRSTVGSSVTQKRGLQTSVSLAKSVGDGCRCRRPPSLRPFWTASCTCTSIYWED